MISKLTFPINLGNDLDLTHIGSDLYEVRYDSKESMLFDGTFSTAFLHEDGVSITVFLRGGLDFWETLKQQRSKGNIHFEKVYFYDSPRSSEEQKGISVEKANELFEEYGTVSWWR